MPDAAFSNPRLAAVYDAFDGDRDDLQHYVAIVDEFRARSVLDVGCGTGTLACLLALRGIEVTGVDPAAASLHIAQQKAGADGVRWILGTAADLPPLGVDMATMTGNVAQVFLRDEDWLATLTGIHDALRPSAHLVFETRDPRRRGWEDWNREGSVSRIDVPGVGAVESWVELLEVELPLVSFRWTYRFQATGDVLTSDSTLRFREKDEVSRSLTHAGFTVEEVRDAPDRPGREFVFLARRSTG